MTCNSRATSSIAPSGSPRTTVASPPTCFMPGPMQFLLAHGRDGFRLLDGQAIRVSRGRIGVLAIPWALAYLAAILDHIPDHVRRTLGNRSG